eukprot:172761_1
MANVLLLSLISIIIKQSHTVHTIYWSTFNLSQPSATYNASHQYVTTWNATIDGWQTNGWARLGGGWPMTYCDDCLYVGWGGCPPNYRYCIHPGYGTATQTFDITRYTNIKIVMYYKVSTARSQYDAFNLQYRYGPPYGSWITTFTQNQDSGWNREWDTERLPVPSCDQRTVQIRFSATTTCIKGNDCWEWGYNYYGFIESILITGLVRESTCFSTTNSPTRTPSYPTKVPTDNPTQKPTNHPIKEDTHWSTNAPTQADARRSTDVSDHPTNTPTNAVTIYPTNPMTRETIIVEENGKLYPLLLLLAIPFIAFCGYRIKQYMDFVVIDKALILIIGICRFDGHKLSDLQGIVSNVNDLRRLWFNTYHYTVKICNEDTLICTKRDVLRFIDQYKHLLEDTQYKAVIVHILSHGAGDDSFVTSDLKTMQTSFFEHELITTAEFAGHPELIKLIFHHACRGHADYFAEKQIYIDSPSNKPSNRFSIELKEIISHREYGDDDQAVPLRMRDSGASRTSKQRKETDAHSNCAVLYGTIEDRALSDNGHFTESICDVFRTNSRNPIKRDLYCLIRQIGRDLETRTNNAQICTSKGIGTIRNKIRFQKCTDKIRFRETH